MSRGLDHIVHAVRDLDAAVGLYRQLGFTVGARNQHPWGTRNHIVQLPGFFIELLAMGEPGMLERDTEHRGLVTHFGAFNRDFIAQREGFSILILESANVAADVTAFAGADIACSGELSFSREGLQADGAPTRVGFTLAFVKDELSPRTGFAVMRQHNPQAFWSTELQSHANGATQVLGVVLVADNPTDHHIFLKALSGERELHATSIGVTAHTPRGDIEIMEQVSFQDQFGISCRSEGEGAMLAGLRIGVEQLDALGLLLRTRNIAFRRHLNCFVVGPDVAHGATLIFEER